MLRLATAQELLVNQFVMGRCNHPVFRIDETTESHPLPLGRRYERYRYEAVCSSCHTRKWIQNDIGGKREPDREEAEIALRCAITCWFSDVVTARIVLRKLNDLGWQGGPMRYKGKYRCTLKNGERTLPLMHSDSDIEAEAIGDAAVSIARVLQREKQIAA